MSRIQQKSGSSKIENIWNLWNAAAVLRDEYYGDLAAGRFKQHVS